MPLKAEEGVSGLWPLERRPVPTQDELIGGTLNNDSIALNMQDVKTIDQEGRTTMVDLGLFVLINVYCPNETNEERLDFKLAFNAMLEARILNLIRLGRQVVVLGDLNICAKPIDHCDPVKRASDHPDYGAFENHPARKWFNEFVGPTGSMVDLGRHFYPDRKSMFTHWETRINARETNYGTRLDYILATPGLLPWIKTCEIQPQIIGSDHCPVIAEFHESITTEEGKTLQLWDFINPPGRGKEEGAIVPEPPKLAAKFYSEFSSEQKTLGTFFSKKGAAPAPTAPKQPKASTSGTTLSASASMAKAAPVGNVAAAPSASAPLPASLSTTASNALPEASSAAPLAPPSVPSPSLALPPAASPSIDLTEQESDDEVSVQPSAGPSTSRASISRSPSINASNGSGAAVVTKKKGKAGQKTIASFFKAPAPPAPTPVTKTNGKSNKKGKGKSKDMPEDQHALNGEAEVIVDDESEKEEEDNDVKELKEKALNGGKAIAQKRKQSSDGNDSDEIREVRKTSVSFVGVSN